MAKLRKIKKEDQLERTRSKTRRRDSRDQQNDRSGGLFCESRLAESWIDGVDDDCRLSRGSGREKRDERSSVEEVDRCHGEKEEKEKSKNLDPRGDFREKISMRKSCSPLDSW